MSFLFGGGGDDDRDEVTQQPAQDLGQEKQKARALRSALLATEGGIRGEEILQGGVGGRNTLFGN
jgi:hypothetical protein